MKKNLTIGIGAVLALAAMLMFVRQYSRNAGTPPESPEPGARVEVKVARVSGVADTLVFQAPGRVTAKKRFSVTSLSEGKIKKVYVSVGEEVKKGQTVVLIENAELDGERGRAGEKLRLGRETVANLEKKVRSSEELLSLGLVSESDVISLKQELNARSTEQRDLETASERLVNRGNNYRVVSGASGYVADIMPEESFVSYGQAVAAIISLENEQIEAFVPPGRIIVPRTGDAVLISYGGTTVPGKVAGEFPSADANLVRMIVVPAKPIPMNLDVTVTFSVRLVKGRLIPKSAVVMDEGRPVVFLVKNGKAIKKVITVEKDYLDRVVVADDFGPDDMLVTENPYLLSDQMDVTVK